MLMTPSLKSIWAGAASLGLLIIPLSSSASMNLFWATKAHARLIELAFPEAAPACLRQMQAGSEDVDRWIDQLKPGLAYRHAMRDPDQSVEEAERLMWQFVESHYAKARTLAAQGQVNGSCFERGTALHPVMDSTSPAHEGFQVWDPLHDPGSVLDHGDLPGSLETLNALLEDPARLRRTIDLMRSVDRKGMAPPIDPPGPQK